MTCSSTWALLSDLLVLRRNLSCSSPYLLEQGICRSIIHSLGHDFLSVYHLYHVLSPERMQKNESDLVPDVQGLSANTGDALYQNSFIFPSSLPLPHPPSFSLPTSFLLLSFFPPSFPPPFLSINKHRGPSVISNAEHGVVKYDGYFALMEHALQ